VAENSCPIGYHILALSIFAVGAVLAWLLCRGLTTGAIPRKTQNSRRMAAKSAQITSAHNSLIGQSGLID
jgi:hypothetical protein